MVAICFTYLFFFSFFFASTQTPAKRAKFQIYFGNKYDLYAIGLLFLFSIHCLASFNDFNKTNEQNICIINPKMGSSSFDYGYIDDCLKLKGD